MEQQAQEFHDRVGRIFEDEDLTAHEKLVMIAHFFYEAAWLGSIGIATATGLSPEQVRDIERSLMRKDWLASPEG